MADAKWHDENGRFKPGNPGGPGRPPKKKEEAVLDSLVAAIPPDEIGQMILDAYAMARKQNSPRSMLAALQLYMSYTLGKPGVMDGASSEGINVLIAQLTQAGQSQSQSPESGPEPPTSELPMPGDKEEA